MAERREITCARCGLYMNPETLPPSELWIADYGGDVLCSLCRLWYPRCASCFRVIPAMTKKEFRQLRRGRPRQCDPCKLLGLQYVPDISDLDKPMDICPYCHQYGVMTRDHLIPRHRGGTYIVMVCRECNTSKGGKNIYDWIEELPRGAPQRYWVPRFLEELKAELSPRMLEILEAEKARARSSSSGPK